MEDGGHIPRNRLRDGWQEDLGLRLQPGFLLEGAEPAGEDFEIISERTKLLSERTKLLRKQTERSIERIHALRKKAGLPPLE